MTDLPPASRRFAIAVSFPGEHRRFVRDVVDRLAAVLGRDRVFYDEWYQAELLGLDGDLKLRRYYREQSELVIPFFPSTTARTGARSSGVPKAAAVRPALFAARLPLLRLAAGPRRTGRVAALARSAPLKSQI